MKRRKRYLAYLLRLWQESAGDPPDGAPPLWRASLEGPQAGERLGFASLVDLFDFLVKETGAIGVWSEHSDENGSRPPVMSE